MGIILVIVLIAVLYVIYWGIQNNNNASSNKVAKDTPHEEKSKWNLNPFDMIDFSVYKSLQREAICPYCNKELDKFPVRSQKCKFCKEKIIRIKKPNEDIAVLLNETEGNHLKTLLNNFYIDKRNYTIYQSMWESEDEYIQLREKYFAENKLGTEDDFMLSYADFRINKLCKKSEFADAGGICLTVLHKCLDLELLVEAERYATLFFELKSRGDAIMIKQINQKSFVTLFTSDNESLNCQIMKGKRMTLEEFRKSKPLPCQECTAEFKYSCGYILDIDRSI